MTVSVQLSLMDHYIKKMTMMLANEFNDLFLFDLLKKEFKPKSSERG